MIDIVVTGATGKMGGVLIKEVVQSHDLTLAGAVVRPGSLAEGKDAGTICHIEPVGVICRATLETFLSKPVVVIDFTSPEATLINAAIAAQYNTPMVIGTTGFSDLELEQLRSSAADIPVVYSPNTSVGVNLFLHTAEYLASLCPNYYAMNISETHHVHKRDAPSGTAKRLKDLVIKAASLDASVVPIHSNREGEVVGEHVINYDGPGDRITITHSAHDRSIFAQGAICAARWLSNQPVGWYSMNDVLGLRPIPMY